MAMTTGKQADHDGGSTFLGERVWLNGQLEEVLEEVDGGG